MTVSNSAKIIDLTKLHKETEKHWLFVEKSMTEVRSLPLLFVQISGGLFHFSICCLHPSVRLQGIITNHQLTHMKRHYRPVKC